MTSKPLSDYKKEIGSGTWFKLHTDAEAAQTPALMAAYAHNFRNLCDKMTACGCEDHCRQMLEDLPPEKFFHLLDENGVPDGCFRHSVECHNRVNKRLGKTVYPYEVIKPLYRNDKPPAPCTKGKEHPPQSKEYSQPREHRIVTTNNESTKNRQQPLRRPFEMVNL